MVEQATLSLLNLINRERRDIIDRWVLVHGRLYLDQLVLLWGLAFAAFALIDDGLLLELALGAIALLRD